MTALPCPITLHKLCVRYGADTIIAPLTHTFAAARWHVILGKSGVGKSTLLRAIAGLIPYDGTITRDPPSLMAQHDDLLPWRSARDNVTLGASLRGEKADNSRAAQLLADVGLAEHAHKYPQHLSGGQRQRVALARTLYENRNLLLMDEPFSAVDAVTRYQLQNLAARLLRGKTVLMITHDPAEALRLADHLYILDHGLRELPANSDPAQLLEALGA